MYLDKYAALSDSKHEIYEFLSSGSKGTIKKAIIYQKIEPDLYNLAFGDWAEFAQK